MYGTTGFGSDDLVVSGVVSESRQISKLQAYKTRPKEFGAIEFSAGNGNERFSIGMVSCFQHLYMPAYPDQTATFCASVRLKAGIKGMGSRLGMGSLKGHMMKGPPPPMAYEMWMMELLAAGLFYADAVVY